MCIFLTLLISNPYSIMIEDEWLYGVNVSCTLGMTLCLLLNGAALHVVESRSSLLTLHMGREDSIQ